MNVLIIEPNDNLKKPYVYLDQAYQTTRVSTIEKAEKIFLSFKPELIFLSCSFEAEEILDFLSKVSNESYPTLIPVLFVVDLTYPISIIPGTSWGDKTAIFCKYSSRREFYHSLNRVLNY